MLVLITGLTGSCVIQAQVAVPPEMPAESPSPAKKHRQHERAEATESPAATAASPATAEAPVKSPKTRRPRRQERIEATPTPAPSPTASRRFSLSGFFKRKSSVSSPPPAVPVTGSTGTATPAAGGGHRLVWVNTETHVYHKEGSRFYGATRKGKYVSEADAIREGDTAAAKGQ